MVDCPVCGWRYSPADYLQPVRVAEAVPFHRASDGSLCPGSELTPEPVAATPDDGSAE